MLFTWSMRPLPVCFWVWRGRGNRRSPLPGFLFLLRLQTEPLRLSRKFDRCLVNELPLLVLVDLGRQVRTVVGRGGRDLGSQPARIEILQLLQRILHPPTVQLPFLVGDLQRLA